MSTKIKVSKEEFLKIPYRDLERLTGVNIRHWSQWFNASKVNNLKKHPSPTLETLRGVSEALDLPLPELVEAFEQRREYTIRRNEKPKTESTHSAA